MPGGGLMDQVKGLLSGVGAPGGPGGPQAKAAEPPGNKGKKLSAYQIYALYADEAGEGLDYASFCALLDHLEIQLVGDQRRELFTKFDTSGDRKIGFKEFEACYGQIQDMVVKQSLKGAGMTRVRLLLLLLYAIIILLLVFVFIFVGVAAFTGAGTVGAVVNSLLAAGSGLAMNLKKSDEASGKTVTVKVGDKTYSDKGADEAPAATPNAAADAP
ncbi:uncharacterized protein HaLaN_31521, partial [Haematococcus lacustris]